MKHQKYIINISLNQKGPRIGNFKEKKHENLKNVVFESNVKR